MITNPSEASQEAMQAKTQAIPPKERTVITIPAGGKKGQVLVKASDNDYDVTWEDRAILGLDDVSGDGTAGQVLTKYGTDPEDYYWADIPEDTTEDPQEPQETPEVPGE